MQQSHSALGAIRVRGLEHIGLVVPDLDSASRLFEDLFGARQVHRWARSDREGFMRQNFDAPQGSSFLACMLILPDGSSLELFEWSGHWYPGTAPHVFAVGGHHLCLEVEAVADALEILDTRDDIHVLGTTKTVSGGPFAGSEWCYARTDWGLVIEVVNRAAVTRNPLRSALSHS